MDLWSQPLKLPARMTTCAPGFLMEKVMSLMSAGLRGLKAYLRGAQGPGLVGAEDAALAGP